MANFRPAGLSDEDSDSDYDYEKPVRTYSAHELLNAKKKLEIKIQDAIINGNLKEVEKIIMCDLNNNVNMKLDSGWTPLMHACFHAQEYIVKVLLDRGADPNLNSDTVTPIMLACSNNSASSEAVFNIISNLLEKGCILNIRDKYGQTPLMRAISSGRVLVVKKLLEQDINIEMRDENGWTALFWAVHHNQAEILELLISHGARLNEVDKGSRKPFDIATSHDHDAIIDILKKYQDTDDCDDDSIVNLTATNIVSWQDYYPGLSKKKPDYVCEIPHLLYGMNCERLTPIFEQSGIDLKTFLLMQEEDMIKIGINMPYERLRLINGLKNFHAKGWKLNSVPGLFARKSDNYSVLDCVATLGSHLQQIYILEATLQYTIREHKKIQNKLKYEPPDLSVSEKLSNSTKKLIASVNNVRKEIKTLKVLLNRISKDNPKPVDIIKPKSATTIAVGYVSEILVICSLGLFAYNAKNIMKYFVTK